MMAGLVEFVYRLLNPIEEKNPRMYHYDVTYGQLAWMLVLTLICYQFTIVGESVYLDAIRALLRNSSLLVKWQMFSLPVGQHEIQVFFEQLSKPREFWNIGRFTWLILKAALVSGIVIGYAILQKRKFYVRSVITYDGFCSISCSYDYPYCRYYVDSYDHTNSATSHYWFLYDCIMHSWYCIVITDYGTYCGGLY